MTSAQSKLTASPGTRMVTNQSKIENEAKLKNDCTANKKLPEKASEEHFTKLQHTLIHKFTRSHILTGLVVGAVALAGGQQLYHLHKHTQVSYALSNLSQSDIEIVNKQRTPRLLHSLQQLTIATKKSDERQILLDAHKRPLYSAPTVGGIITSFFGSRWGTIHGGIDIANPIGTPIYSVADGEVISAGPASGFGLWVRVKHYDGTMTVYGHVNTINVKVGQKVMAGDEIATVGNRGFSTGPHLHFEVWLNNAAVRSDPLPWLINHHIYS